MLTNKRPHLVITHTNSPMPGVKTHRAGWGNDPENWNTQEIPQIVDHVSFNQLKTATVIIDILRNKVIKSRYGNDNNDVLEHFKQRYQEEIAHAVQVWLARQVDNKAKELLNTEIGEELQKSDEQLMEEINSVVEDEEIQNG